MRVRITIDPSAACLAGDDYRGGGHTVDVDISKLTCHQRGELALHPPRIMDGKVCYSFEDFDINEVGDKPAPEITRPTEEAIIALIDKCIDMRSKASIDVAEPEDVIDDAAPRVHCGYPEP